MRRKPLQARCWGECALPRLANWYAPRPAVNTTAAARPCRWCSVPMVSAYWRTGRECISLSPSAPPEPWPRWWRWTRVTAWQCPTVSTTSPPQPSPTPAYRLGLHCRGGYFQCGESVLVNGAAGTSGHLALQVAKYLGASRVIATARNLAVEADLRALGRTASSTSTSRPSNAPPPCARRSRTMASTWYSTTCRACPRPAFLMQWSTTGVARRRRVGASST